MPKIVLLPVSGTSADAEVFAASLAVARAFDSHLIALHVRPDARRDIASLAASDGGMSAGIDTNAGKDRGRYADARRKVRVRGLTSVLCTFQLLSEIRYPDFKGVT